MRIERVQIRMSILVLAMTAVFVGVWWWPAMRDIHRLNERIADSDEQLGLTRNRADGLSRLVQEVDYLHKRLAAGNKTIPRQVELASMLRELSVQVETEHLAGQGITTLPTVNSDDYVALPVELTFQGDSRSVFRFVQRVEDMPRLIQVNSLWINKPANAPDQVQAKLRVMAYFSPAEEAKPQ